MCYGVNNVPYLKIFIESALLHLLPSLVKVLQHDWLILPLHILIWNLNSASINMLEMMLENIPWSHPPPHLKRIKKNQKSSWQNRLPSFLSLQMVRPNKIGWMWCLKVRSPLRMHVLPLTAILQAYLYPNVPIQPILLNFLLLQLPGGDSGGVPPEVIVELSGLHKCPAHKDPEFTTATEATTESISLITPISAIAHIPQVLLIIPVPTTNHAHPPTLW